MADRYTDRARCSGSHLRATPRRCPALRLPYVDSGLATISLVAQWMMTRKILENWVLWIIADIAYVPMYIYKGLPVTAALYAIFLVLAVIGLRSWLRSYREQRHRSSHLLA